ncbi:hypothetical protein HN031_14505 [Nocardioides sp. zg-1308]|uniref:Gmad2 immunoglobulin-like domain-containing protein n=1 Tax=Nocardioides sp. zg-1308 TaxID=2736253 RepID=UPI001553313F|nr:Gmad2 immunoglobulin-like domain-containing protein [Nocardioides sp. zg-1308]NPD05899.1 hypothetical protein [Nocardioides sp. zg-1308]
MTPTTSRAVLARAVRRRAGAAVVVVATSLVLVACGEDPRPVSDSTSEPTASDGAQQSESPSPSPVESSTGTPTESPTESTSEAPSESGTAVPVYFAGDGPGGRTALFREFHRVQGDPLTEAARLVAGGGQPDDPDYRTLWPQMEVASVTATDGVLLVQLPSDAFTEAPDGMSRRDARLALQQLVLTLQGVQQERVPVVVQRDAPGLDLFGRPTGTPVSAASALRTLNLVNITSPAEGDTVSGDTVTVTGVANSFEASGPCRLLQGGQEVALEGYQSDGWMEDRLFPFEVELPLGGVTGEVVVQCETDDPSGGAEGNGPSVDTKTITVR